MAKFTLFPGRLAHKDDEDEDEFLAALVALHITPDGCWVDRVLNQRSFKARELVFIQIEIF